MIETGELVVAGVSGGADSVCLLLLLRELAEEMGFFVKAVHVEHGIRGEESLGDAAFVEELCKEQGIDLLTYHVEVPLARDESGHSPEEAARELRYDCFLQACEECGTEKLVLAHHADDTAETMLFHLARGTGIRGMCGIRPVSEHLFSGEERGAAARLVVLRPLLCATREEILAWLSGRGQAYRTDSTNADSAYARNRIRERVLPELTGINARAVPHMRQFADQMEAVCDYLDETAWEDARRIVSIGEDPSPTIRIACAPFLELREVPGRHLLLLLLGIAAGSRRDITSGHVEQVMGLMTADVGAKVSLPGGVTAERTYDAVVLRACAPGADTIPPQTLTEQALRIPGETVMENGLCFSAELFDARENGPAGLPEEIPRKTYTKWFDYDKIKGVVLLRSRKPGDYLITDADGGHKKLKKFFIDEKVPLSERDEICLLADGDHILWVVGGRISEAYKVTEDTKRILQVRAHGAGLDEEQEQGPGIHILFTEEQITERIRELGAAISADLAGEPVRLVCVLKGAGLFAAELAKRITAPVYLDFISCSSYGDQTESSRAVRIAQDLETDIAGENVLIAEDILDTGRTIRFLVEEFTRRGAKRVLTCVMLDKPARRETEVSVDYIGFTIPDEFVVGYGLDYAQMYRNLPYIGTMES